MPKIINTLINLAKLDNFICENEYFTINDVANGLDISRAYANVLIRKHLQKNNDINAYKFRTGIKGTVLVFYRGEFTERLKDLILEKYKKVMDKKKKIGITIYFSAENYQYLNELAKLNGVNISRLVNGMITQNRKIK